MELFKFDFLENEFWVDQGVRFKCYFQNPTSFFHRILSMYRGILELKNYTRILRKNGLFANKTCCGLTALFVKTEIFFCRCNFANKQINKISSIVFSYRLQSIDKTHNFSEKVCSFGNGTQNKWAPTKNVPVQHEKLINSFPKQNILLNREFHKLSNNIHAAMIRKKNLIEF